MKRNLFSKKARLFETIQILSLVLLVVNMTFSGSIFNTKIANAGELDNEQEHACEIDQTRSCTHHEHHGIQKCGFDFSWGDCQETSICGDGIKNGDEECDNGPIGSATCSADCKIIEQPSTPSLNIVADKIVCANESDLPNWGTGGPDITSNTASEFLANHPTCHLEPNWYFQWSASTSRH